MLPTMQGLVEYAMYVSRGGLPMSVRDTEYQWIFTWRPSSPHGLINQ